MNRSASTLRTGRTARLFPATSRRVLAAIVPCVAAGLFLVALGGTVRAEEPIVHVGDGSYTLVKPKDTKEPPETIFKTDNVRGPIPTNDWWSSLAWTQFSEPQYAHPLVLRAIESGMRIQYPGPSIHADRVGIHGGMGGGADDFVLGHSEVAKFPDARLHAYSDWFVTASMAEGDRRMLVSYGHGSPFVYAIYGGGQPRLTFAKPPQVFSGTADEPVLGVSVNRRYYGLFGPSGSRWSGLDSASVTCRSGGRPYFSVALLPDDKPETLALFRRHAYAHVVDTKVQWAYVPQSSSVWEKFTFTTKAYEGDERATLTALYPHQWSHTGSDLLDLAYDSVRGPMKLLRGTSFLTKRTFPGVLPSLPNQGDYDKQRLRQYVEEESGKEASKSGDTYWGGKRLGKLATLVPIAEQVGAASAKDKLLGELRQRLEGWFTATGEDTGKGRKGRFYLNRTWGTLIGYPASYGSDDQLNDHHFHYGYFIKAAAEVARWDAAWASDEKWGGMVKLLVRDIASPERQDPLFPWLRNFDPYAGHSWASGSAKFASGNNQESSSEAMNAWTGLILWGETTGDRAIRDLGIYLYTVEMDAINAYWFDVLGQYRPKDYRPSVVTMIWGGKGVNETWFSKDPEMVHGINWIPIHGGSLYLGQYPEHVRRNYEAMVAEKGSPGWEHWGCLALMYRALDDPADAIRQFDARPDSLPVEAGNSRANVYHWIHNLSVLGQVDRTTTANYPLYAVFRKGREKSYVVYNAGDATQTIQFSDGMTLEAPSRKFVVRRRTVGQ